MQTPLKSKTLSKTLHCPAKKVYDYVSNLENLPKWARAFAKSIQQKDGMWVIQTDQGPVQITMVENNDFGILDHYVSPAPDVKIYVPMRVIKNAEGCEITFMLFQALNMPDNEFSRQLDMVDQDLNLLKEIMAS